MELGTQLFLKEILFIKFYLLYPIYFLKDGTVNNPETITRNTILEQISTLRRILWIQI